MLISTTTKKMKLMKSIFIYWEKSCSSLSHKICHTYSISYAFHPIIQSFSWLNCLFYISFLSCWLPPANLLIYLFGIRIILWCEDQQCIAINIKRIMYIDWTYELNCTVQRKILNKFISYIYFILHPFVKVDWHKNGKQP